MSDDDSRALTPGLPDYTRARHFLRILDGVSYSLYRSTYNAIWDQRGSPQENEDWTNPDEWIVERLSGDEQALAKRIWKESKHELNPRYLRGSWYMTTKHDLLVRGSKDVLQVTNRGRQFLDNPEGKVVAEIDSYEGILTILQLVAERGPGKRGEFLPGFSSFCMTETTYRSENVIKGALYDRLRNLVERGYVEMRSQTYEVTEAGLRYLEQYAALVPGRQAAGQHTELRRLTKDLTQQARDQLSEYLLTMDPYKFEELVKFLLEQMGYTNVKTTPHANDKGVDVVADIQLGISSVREVVQVKRRQANLHRPVLDQLRGSLHRFGAVRGTIITTGGFSKGTMDAAFESGASPITLIDGEKLVDLLVAHEIGVTKRTVEYLEFDVAELTQFEVEEGPDGSE
ncbi:MAG: restriction endonuclease [Anaerolineae bacterium]|nr:restriction endonuclease [Anaerolineae bacterium]